MVGRRTWFLVGGLVLSLLLVGCGGGSKSSPAARVTVSPAGSLADQPVHLSVRGLTAGEHVTLRVSSTDRMGVRWSSSQQFVADGSGRVDVDHAVARSGSYTGVWGMGPIAMMQPETTSRAGAYFWSNQTPLRFHATVIVAGTSLASTSFQRRFTPGPVAATTQTLHKDGFVANFSYPSGTTHHAAVLVLGGSEGGTPGALTSSALVAQGYPVLALAYFKAPGLPSSLSRIPLEYFAKALRWMGRQPQVDPSRIAVLGGSRGSEAAQLLGVHYPKLVHAVIATVPSDAAICSYPGCKGPAWMLHGQAIPYTRQFDQPHPAGQADAVIPDQRIRGPVLLNCGGQDKIWNSCAYSAAIQQRLNAAHFRYRHILYRYPNAGHGIALLFEPYEPTVAADYAQFGGTPQANQQAIAQNWPRLLAFLTTFSHR